MRTASAYLSKLKAETRGNAYKIQDTNHRLVASTLYRGAVGCGPANYSQLSYIIPVCPTVSCKRTSVGSILSGGSPSGSGGTVLSGGNPSGSGSLTLNGGNP